jgi:hypothetical protein
MLFINFGRSKKALKKIDNAFKCTKLPSWYEDPVVKDMIRDVDLSEVIAPDLIKSPVHGYMSGDLSGGVKTLIMMYKIPKFVAWGGAMGDNCYEWVFRIGNLTDCEIWIDHSVVVGEGLDDPRLKDEGVVKATVGNTGAEISTLYEFYEEWSKYVIEYYRECRRLEEQFRLEENSEFE